MEKTYDLNATLVANEIVLCKLDMENAYYHVNCIFLDYMFR